MTDTTPVVFTLADRRAAKGLADKLRQCEHTVLADHLEHAVEQAAWAQTTSDEMPRIEKIVGESWGMFSAEANQRVTAVVRGWARELAESAWKPRDAIDVLDTRLDAVHRDHPEIRDTEPREHLAVTVKRVLECVGFDAGLTRHSRYAASIWE